MYFQGGILEGFKYGGASPLDFTGLVSWHRSTEVTFLYGSIINTWPDLSGNANHLVSFNGNKLENTPMGLAVVGTSGNSRLYPPFDKHNFMIDGSPFTMITVAYGSGVRYTIWDATGSGNQFAMTYGSTGVTHQMYNISSQLTLNFSPTYPSILNRPNIMTFNGYGYNVTDNDVSSYVNNIVTPSGSANYIRVPNIDPATPKRFGLFTPSGGKWCELIIYNQTGKTREQIDIEITRLYNEYLLIRYPIMNQYT